MESDASFDVRETFIFRLHGTEEVLEQGTMPEDVQCA